MHRLETLVSDLRFAFRMLRKSPLFTVVAVLAIALGTGAVTTIFSAMNAVLFQPLPGATAPDRLASIERTRSDGGGSLSASYPFYEALRDRTETFEGLAAWSKVELTIADGDEGAAAYGNLVSGNYFDVLGVRPELGRFFVPDEDRTLLGHPVLVVSDGFWRSRLGADPSALGRTLQVNGHPFTLIGVAPKGFRGAFTPLRTDAWAPLTMQPALRPRRDLGDDSQAWLRVFGRLRDGVSEEQARQELATLTAVHAADADEPEEYRAFTGVRLSPMTGLPADAHGAALGFMSLLLGAAVLVLLIASVNVASMLSARAVARRREMAVRTALGAGRWRLVRQLVTESLVLFVLGAGGGTLLAVLATDALEHLPLPADVPVALELSPDGRVLAFTLLVALVTGLIFGLAPALQAARKDVTARLRDGSAGSGARRSRTANVLIVGQLALSLLLLVAAGLFLRALDRGHGIDPGFDVTGVATVSLEAEAWGYDEAKARSFYQTLRERVETMPGVTSVSYSGFLPLALGSSGDTIAVDGADRSGESGGSDAREVPIQLADVDAGYFSVLRMPIVRGRPFAASDDERAPNVAVINETLARRAWPEGDAIGSTFEFRGERVTVVGIARDAKYADLGPETPSFAYFPISQLWRPAHTLLVRTEGDPLGLAPALERSIHSIDPAIPRPTVVSLEQATSIVLLPQRVASMVTGALGVLGLLLAAVGLYGIIAYSASRRTREIGVRVALGARRADVLGLIVRDGMRLAAVGAILGLVLAAGATRLLESFLFGVSPLDVVTFALGAAVFLGVALVASYLPARTAAAEDPVEALRAE